MRFSARLLTSALLLAVSTLAAHAAPVTYDITLTDPSNPADDGTGMFTIASAPSATGLSVYSGLLTGANELDALSITVDGDTFTLAQDPAAAVTFLDGTLSGIGFYANDGTFRSPISLTTAFLGYAFDDAGKLGLGAIIDPPVASPVPEPNSIVLLGTGLLGGAASLYRRARFRRN